ncbi:peptidyl-tRNA hydrolase [Boletus edulis BED1]|uniref:peptidyl-tRNA hydrolase n=1 Tax=Boletus edulis BED1 TaxID=1328754 RepID=A0AAD4GHW0_BOLED|nr:peptidyl-tRNA hydrolase [Boletus edulis BED1]
MHLLLVGLGNLPFPNTRHSVGHIIVDALASRFAIRMSPSKALDGFTGHSHVTLGESHVDLTLFKPKPLMNITGPAVASALRHTTRSPGTMIVIHDSLQHKPKTLSVKFGGSANGHNGVRSVIAALGGDPNFYRFRIGIGRDGDTASYVLGRLSAEECAHWDVGGGLDMICKELSRVALKPPVT